MELKEIPLQASKIKAYGPYCEYSIDDLPSDLPEAYRAFLADCNGGKTFDDFFHFLGLTGPIQHNVIEWNRDNLWKCFYHLDSASFVFAEDVFGDQFFFKPGRKKNEVYMLDPCDGKTYWMARNYRRFLRDIVDERGAVFSERKALAHAFFAAPGNKSKHLHHLSHKIPVILSGSEGDINNLEQCDSLANLSILGQIVNQLENVKPGTVIKDIEVDYAKMKIRLVF